MGATFGAGYLRAVTVPADRAISTLTELGAAIGDWVIRGGSHEEFPFCEIVGDELVVVNVVPGHPPYLYRAVDDPKIRAQLSVLHGGLPWSLMPPPFDEVNMVAPVFGVKTGLMTFAGRRFFVASGDDVVSCAREAPDAEPLATAIEGCNAVCALLIIDG